MIGTDVRQLLGKIEREIDTRSRLDQLPGRFQVRSQDPHVAGKAVPVRAQILDPIGVQIEVIDAMLRGVPFFVRFAIEGELPALALAYVLNRVVERLEVAARVELEHVRAYA